jgi:hypothetical protein
MHYMQAMHAVTPEEAEYRLFATEHDYHMGLQDCMRYPIGFHAEMMGDIMYFHQSMKQLIKRDEVPKDVEVMPSV